MDEPQKPKIQLRRDFTIFGLGASAFVFLFIVFDAIFFKQLLAVLQEKVFFYSHEKSRIEKIM